MSEVVHIDDRVDEMLLGDVGESEREAMEAHAALCPRCHQVLLAARESFALLAAALPPTPPSPSLREKIIARVEPRPMARFVGKLAALFDVTPRRARTLIDRLELPEAWMPGPVAGSWLMMFDGAGPKLEGAFCGFVKMSPSVSWPRHTHLGTEHMLVLAGGFRQDDGFEVHPGMLHTMREGTSHDFVILDDGPCISAAVVFGGVRFDDPSFALGPLSQ